MVVQPGAVVGGLAYCPVSGVEFQVKEKGAQRDVAGRPIHFCCEGCARYFSENADRVIAARGLAAPAVAPPPAAAP